MKYYKLNLFLFLPALIFTFGLLVPRNINAQAILKIFVYSDQTSQQDRYIPSGWMGDYGDISLKYRSLEASYSGKTSLKFVYTAQKAQARGWAGVYWQNPANNWGNKKGGYNLTGITKLTFWARGKNGGEIIQKFIVGGITGKYPDSTRVEIGPLKLTDEWKQYTINLAGKNLSYINGGFCWVTTADLNPEGAVFYIDDIIFEADPLMKAEMKKPEEMPFYIYEDSRILYNHFTPAGWMGDYDDIEFTSNSKDSPFSGDTCIKIIYKAISSQGARWAGIYWQNPADNWGDIDQGFDLSKAKMLTFWAKGAKGGERIEEFKVGGIGGRYADSDSSKIGPVILNNTWTPYNIDLRGKDLSNINGGFCWAANLDNNPQGATFYLDKIQYE